MKGIYLANAASACCYFFVAVTGYSAYGNTVDDDVLASRPRASKGWIALANLMVISSFVGAVLMIVLDVCIVEKRFALSTAVQRSFSCSHVCRFGFMCLLHTKYFHIQYSMLLRSP